jgi:cytochrome P450 family 4
MTYRRDMITFFVYTIRSSTSELFTKRFVSLIGRFNFTYKWLSPDYKRSQLAIRQLHEFTASVIKQRRAQLETTAAHSIGSCDVDSIGSKRKLAFLDMLLQSDAKLSDQDIREEVDTFMFEGHDTTAVVLAFALMLLSRNGRVQQKLYEELIRVLDDDKADFSLDQLNQLKYLECVIKESLRLYPSVPFIGRTLREDVKLSDNVVLPSGVLVFLSIMSMHRDERNFEDADQFIPERFGDKWTRRTTNFDYVPFSAGPRNCIGNGWI